MDDRVVSSVGLGGYTGGADRSLDIKRWLLTYETGAGY